MKYTFKVLGKDDKVYYPKQFVWEKENAKPGVGALDFEWTENIDEAKTWGYKNVCEDIAFEFVDAMVIEIPTSEITNLDTSMNGSIRATLSTGQIINDLTNVI